MTALMRGFPPAPESQVTLANWRRSPFNHWAFHHVREILPTAEIPNDPGRAADFAASLIDFAPLRIDDGGGGRLSFEEFLDRTDTDGIVILHRGRVVYERYANGMTAGAPHILMSLSKSLLGLLAGVLIECRALEAERAVTDVIPEVAGTAYRDATVRHLLDMRAGVAFDEDYLATSGPIVAYRKAAGWDPRGPGDPPSDLRSFYRELTKSAGPHGGPFNYVSPNTDLLGWVIERATGVRYADLVSELVWKPMGATRSAYITVDRLGAPRCAGGLCATVRDLARVGELIVHEGARESAQVVPAAWIDDIVRNGDPDAWAAGAFVGYYPGLRIRYRSQWYAQDGQTPLLFGLGIHGQNLFVDRRRATVIATVSSQAPPLDAEGIGLTTRAVSAVLRFLDRAAR